jgi:hypothetical protein
MIRALLAARSVLVIAGVAIAADHAPAPAAAKGGTAPAANAKGGAATPVGAGSIVIGTISVPVLTGKKVRAYEYAMVGLKVGDAAKYLKQICDQRFELVDAFFTALHNKPFASGSQVDGPRAQQELLVLAKQVGGDFITGLDIVWSAAPRPVDPTVFGNNQTVACRAG